MTSVLYALLVVLGLLDAALITPALRASTSTQTTGRLLSTLLTLAGLVVTAGTRWEQDHPQPPLIVVALVAVDAGLVGYALWLPERGVLQLWRRRRGRERGW